MIHCFKNVCQHGCGKGGHGDFHAGDDVQCLKLTIVFAKIILSLLDNVRLINNRCNLMASKGMRLKQLLKSVVSEETFG